jgi:hypothetical protein
LPKDLVNLQLLRAFGVTKFTGPCNESFVITY